MEENVGCSMNSYAGDYEMAPNEVITDINTSEILEGCMIENEIIAEPSTMEQNNEHFIVDNVTFEDEIVEQCKVIGSVKNYIPKVGMEFETEKEAHAFYNYYAMKEGFGIKIKSSHVRKSTQELCHVLFACCKEGFTNRIAITQYSRPDTRTGCKARLRVKLTDYKKWRVTEVNIEHNHQVTPRKARFYKSHKHLDAGSKRRLELNNEAGIRFNKSYHSLVVDAGGYEKLSFGEKECRNHIDRVRRRKLAEGDATALHQFFCRMQCKNSSFFYLMDFDDDERLKNVFWIDAKSRASGGYFGDVITFDTTYLTNRYNMAFAPFVGVNHHGQSTLLGCGLILHETKESFTWLFKAWLAAMRECHPKAIITDQCKAIEGAIAEIFPRTRHRLCLWHIMRKLSEKLGGLSQYHAVKKALENAVYDSLKIETFETSWMSMIKEYDLAENEWLTNLYEIRQKWVPVYLKDTFYAGMSTTQRSESMNAFFDKYVNSQTYLKEFVDKYEMALKDKYEKEMKADFESFNGCPVLTTECCFEIQLSKVYTKGIFKKFQREVTGMCRCFTIDQVKVDEGIITCVVKERVFYQDLNRTQIKEFEVLFDVDTSQVNCICGLFYFKGFLCRHALYILNYHGVDKVPTQYILQRWRKDFKRSYNFDNCYGDNVVGVPVQRYDNLYQLAIHLVEEGAISQHTYEVAFRALKKACSEVKSEIEYTKNTHVGSCSGNENICEGIECNPWSEDHNIVRDPLRVTRKGRPTGKRNKPAYEKKTNKAKKLKTGPTTLSSHTNQHNTQENIQHMVQQVVSEPAIGNESFMQLLIDQVMRLGVKYYVQSFSKN
ncbi:hypothetical protein HHK36_019593 [Tetracentron sinense]|uniref:Protein FAR1-RELATED SEQUENCE n=1 Tax=Tetracentron sinense TaxID=13715 RepID=A0A835D9A5_TETSI|nr:hypothetical protein HHK36_019593 [Tetracentron sinense]